VSSVRLRCVPRSTRDRPAKTPLSIDAVVDAGLRVLRAEGIDAISMRRVGAELDTGAASLYVYVHNRQDLLNQMFDAVAGQIDLTDEADPERWREQLEQLLTATRAAMDRYPGIARVPLANVPTGPNSIRVSDHLLGILRAGGVNDRSAAWFADVVFLYVNAAAFERSIYAAEGAEETTVQGEIEQSFMQLDPETYPNIVALMPYLTSGQPEERFAFGLRLMINGLLNTQPPG
jgi:AcrR family transcriptional regulator